jgi:redox-sensitive bicupin YhaK (pirin superfamily)
VEAKDVPEVRGLGSRVRVLAGALDGHRSPLTELLTPIAFFDVHLEPSAELRVPLPRGHNSTVLAIAGSGLVGADADRHALPEHGAAAFADDGDEVALAAGSTGLEVLVLAGAPIGEPVIFGGPFAMTSRAEIQDAFARYERGEMGHLEPSFRARR